MENVLALSEHVLLLLHERYLRRDDSGHLVERPRFYCREARRSR
jgi:hypothetical protein